MDYILGVISGAILIVFIVSWSDMKRAVKKKRLKKRYEKLAHGVPKKTVYLITWSDLFHYRNYPVYIDGQTFEVSDFDWWHCNDDIKTIKTVEGEILYISKQHYGTSRYGFEHGFNLSTKYGYLGKRVFPCAVIEVY